MDGVCEGEEREERERGPGEVVVVVMGGGW